MVRQEGKKSINTAWIFCEGETERKYFLQYRAVERIRGLQIRPIVSENKDIVGLVNDSIDYEKNHSRDFFEGDLIFCVVDRDLNSNEDFDGARNLANESNRYIVLSNPCFEYWILSHFEHYFEPIEHELLKRKLNKYLKNYKKNDPDIYNKTKEKIDNAIKNSKKTYKMYVTDELKIPIKEDYPVTFNKKEILNRKSNPITLVFKLIEILAKYKI